MDKPLEGYLSIGQVLRPQGLKGQVKIRPDTDDPGRFSMLSRVFLRHGNEAPEQVAVSKISIRSGFVYLNLGEDNSIEDAELRRNAMLLVPRSEAVPLEAYENFIVDLIGCTLTDTQGTRIGVLQDVLQPGANDVYLVATDKGRLLVPALRHVILSVDVAAKIILADADRLWEVSIFED